MEDPVRNLVSQLTVLEHLRSIKMLLWLIVFLLLLGFSGAIQGTIAAFGMAVESGSIIPLKNVAAYAFGAIGIVIVAVIALVGYACWLRIQASYTTETGSPSPSRAKLATLDAARILLAVIIIAAEITVALLIAYTHMLIFPR